MKRGLDLLKQTQIVDVTLSDINMPVNGRLELLSTPNNRDLPLKSL
ncbi:MAG: hypothetical protein IPK25_09350 [Saprospiraceae bacterium]|nr:hypothetical protein [Saprospiraceae bacterium]